MDRSMIIGESTTPMKHTAPSQLRLQSPRRVIRGVLAKDANHYPTMSLGAGKLALIIGSTDSKTVTWCHSNPETIKRAMLSCPYVTDNSFLIAAIMKISGDEFLLYDSSYGRPERAMLERFQLTGMHSR